MALAKRYRTCLRSTHDFCAVPLRLAISILLLMVGGLVAMYGCAVLAQLMYGVVLPAIASQNDPDIDTSGLGLTRNGVLFVSIFGAIMVVELTVLVISIASTMFSYLGMAAWFRDQWRTLFNFDPRLAYVPRHIPKRLRRLKNENVEEMVELSSKLDVLGVTKTSNYARDQDSTLMASINYMGMGSSQFIQVSQAMDFCERVFLWLFFLTVLVSFTLCFFWAPYIVASQDNSSPPTSINTEMYNQPPSISFDTYARAFVMILVVATNFILFFGLVIFLFYRAIWGLLRAVSGWCTRASKMNIYGVRRALLFGLFFVLSPVVLLIAPLPLLLYRTAVRTRILIKRHCTRSRGTAPAKRTDVSTRVLDAAVETGEVSTPVAVHLPVRPSGDGHSQTMDNVQSDNGSGSGVWRRYWGKIRGLWRYCIDAFVTVSRAYIRSMPLPDYADSKNDWKNVSVWNFLFFSATFDADIFPSFLRCICVRRSDQDGTFASSKSKTRKNNSIGDIVHNPTAIHRHGTFEIENRHATRPALALSSTSPTPVSKDAENGTGSGSATGAGMGQLEVYKAEVQPIRNHMRNAYIFILQLVLGAGNSSWDNFCAFLTHTNAWYLSLWFLGSLIHVTTYPQVCLTLGILSIPALSVGLYNVVYQANKARDIRRENLWLRHLYAILPNRLAPPPRLNEQKYILKNLQTEAVSGAPAIGNLEMAPLSPSHIPHDSPRSDTPERSRINTNPLAPVSSAPGTRTSSVSSGGTDNDPAPGGHVSGIPFVNPINPILPPGDGMRRSSRRERLEYLQTRSSQRQLPTTDYTSGNGVTGGATGSGGGGGGMNGDSVPGEASDGQYHPDPPSISASTSSPMDSDEYAARLGFVERKDFNPETVVEDTSVPCAWGALILGFCIVATLLSWNISIPMGVSMSITLLFIIGNACLRPPSSTFAATTCRIILVLVAALYGVMTSALGEGSSKGSLMAISPDWTGNPLSPPERIEPFDPANIFNAQVNAYGACGTRLNSLSPLDMCFFSASMYNEATDRDLDIQSWFQQEGRTVTPIALPNTRSGITIAAFHEHDDSFHPPSHSMHDLSTWGYKERIYIAIRGTKVARDVSQDALIWQESLLFKLLSTIGPFSSWPISAIQTFIGFVGTVKYQFRGPWGHLSYADEAVSIINDLRKDYPDASFVITGHSLGGGLSTIVGQRLDIPYVSFSGPGALFSAIKLGITNRKGTGLVFVPAYDIVPLIDVHTSTVQQLQCLNAASALSCHSIARTCCELRRACGDIGGHNRTLTSCQKYV